MTKVVLTDLIDRLALDGLASQEAITGLVLGIATTALKDGDLELAQSVLQEADKRASGAKGQLEVAELLIALAAAWNRREDAPDRVSRAEAALRRAIELAPERATPALAQHLQRRGRTAEAIEQWRHAIRLLPSEGAYYLNLARLLEETGQLPEAYKTYIALLSSAPSDANCLIVANRLDAVAPIAGDGKSIKIALLGNATLNQLESYLKVECYKLGLRPEFYIGGFDQYSQEILNPQSSLYAFAPDVLVLAVHASRLFPALHAYPFDMAIEQREAEIEAGITALRNLLDTFTQRSPALVLLHNVVAPQHPALGILDLRDELGQSAMFSRINLRLAELARSRYSSVYIVDEDRIQAQCGKAQATDARLWLAARMPWSGAVMKGLAGEYATYIRAARGLSRKCIVVDLDNTLWGGVIGEDGLKGIQIGPDAPGNAFVAFQRELERFWRRGILLAICSKNNPEDAREVFDKHPGMALKLHHFAAQRINWEPKPDNIRDLAMELNIGLDSLVFFDDNPVERARVRAELPDVIVPELPDDPAMYRQILLGLGVFDTLTFTEEDRKRNALYAEQRLRHEYLADLTGPAAPRSVEEHLAGLGINVEIAPVGETTLARIAQLTNKTNQFNLTTRRYNEAQITRMQADGSLVLGMTVSDRFGDAGLTGVAIVRPIDAAAWEIDTFLLSCRVMGRGVETALLAFIVGRLKEKQARVLCGWYLPTAKNAPVKDFYSQHGFTLARRKEDGAELWALDPRTEAEPATPGWITVRTAVMAV